MVADPDVVIIGAGAAGVGAARRLADSGFSVAILEASARIGGRAFTEVIAGLPLDLGCEWLHSATRNPWTRIAEACGFAVDRRAPAWDRQHRDLGFPKADQRAADLAFAAWSRRLAKSPPDSDCAADALPSGDPWNGYIEAIAGYLNGAALKDLSVADYLAYEDAAGGGNWRLPSGYGTLVAASLPRGVALRCATPVEALALAGRGVALSTPSGDIFARAVIVTVSTAVLSSGAIRLPPALAPWLDAAARLPLGRNEKVFLEILGDGPFEPDSHVMGRPCDARTGAYMIRSFGWPVIEGFFGGAGAEILEREGPAAGFAFATDELAGLFGSDVRAKLRPLVATGWSRMTRIGGGYSHALPGSAAARQDLARPFEDRVFFAGEATDPSDYSTAHGACASGVRAAEEALAALTARARVSASPAAGG
ncbi:monoamine oxidase [Roseiarcus fermentans]|uniref:Tryptophan 2-monooxygenase n=1 Tax=Roseiarcus fermentans TaxID=1473586 RepID=A0A366FBF7_9HYPH|nr:NAD(P)/FAD-dependent oxidoreductase [Roseiarcus fermentans]RBP12003.1 monoamine oxidase [Roseiarcus fermentans]